MIGTAIARNRKLLKQEFERVSPEGAIVTFESA